MDHFIWSRLRVTLTELRYIVAVARERHFGRAASKCFVSQPTLSVGVKKLEEELGVALFERGSQEVSVTEAGKPIIEQAQRVLEETERIKEIAQGHTDALSGPLRVGAIYTIGPYLFPELISRLRKLAPDMPLIVEEGFTRDLRVRLKQGDIEIAILSLPFTEGGVETLPLYYEPFVVLLPASHPLNQKKLIRPEQITGDELLLLGPGHCFRDQVLNACPDCAPGGDRSDGVEGSSLETIRHMVASGLGITIVPCTAAGADKYTRRLLTVRRLSGSTPGRTVALAYRGSFPRREAILALRDAVRACALSCVTMVSD